MILECQARLRGEHRRDGAKRDCSVAKRVAFLGRAKANSTNS